MKNQHLRNTWIACAITIAITLPTAKAVLTVDYTASATADTNGTGLSAGAVPYSLVTQRSPTIGTNSYGGTNPTFYGGITPTGTGSINQWLFETTDSQMRFRLNVANSGDSASAVFLWQQADFLNGQSSGSVNFDSSSSFSVNSRRFGSSLTTELRFVFQEGSNMYISASQGAVPSSYTVVTLSNPAAASWFNYNPASSITTIGSAATPTFSGVNALGVYFSISSTSAGNHSIAFNDFQVDAVAVPEPNAAALFLASLATAFLVLRRHRRA